MIKTCGLSGKFSFIGLLLLISTILSSCADSKLSQCQKIIILTQKTARNSEEHRQSNEMQKVLEMADLFEESANNMKSLKIKDTQLITYQEGFAEVYQSHAETTRKFIEALQKKDITSARSMKDQVQQIGVKEQRLGEEMNAYCQGE